jgi:hypothetical protein
MNIAAYLQMTVHQRINAKSNFIDDFQDANRWPNLIDGLRCYYQGHARPITWGKSQPNTFK